MRGTIFAVKRYAIHDGPNIRTTVFFKGCPLRCGWCHNPEGLHPGIELASRPGACIGCSACVDACPAGCLTPDDSGVARDVARCIGCGSCVQACPALVHEPTGWETGTDALLAELEKDLPFFDHSGGGVTFSGGEPLMQPDFLLSMLRACGAAGMHRVVDTSGYAPADIVMEVAGETDLFLYDLKHMESAVHRELTGVDNALILDNLRRLAGQGQPLQIRMPLVPGVNDDRRNLQRTGEFVRALPGMDRIDLLPYHPSAIAKYRKLSMPCTVAELAAPDAESVARAVRQLRACGLKVRVGG